ncbi:hypothetical protein B0O99DRAFT_508949 [Bisporella sp. PMI_857]|nr:hypothetical protein B0O99DRAFT_508949 [Bisporella sp. PMI_857]
MRLSTLLSSILATSAACVAGDPIITSFKNSLSLSASFDPIKAAYWTGLPHHRRTPFSVSPDGKSAYLAYLDSTYNTVRVQQVDTATFAAVGTPFSTKGYEAAGLVAQNDGFALLATIDASGSTDLPPDNTPIVSLIRVKGGVEAWRTPLNGPGVHAADGLTDTAEANGDLVYSAASGLYAAYFVVAAYSGYASGHFGDSIQYVNDNGARQDIASASTFGCSHNTGIGLEAADAPPFASVCAEDHGAIWLNTETRYMSGVKIANENTTNGVSGEPMGGMSGSYSNLALFPGTTSYIFAWQSRGALNLYTDSWMEAPYTQCSPRWLNHNVAIATLSSKSKLTGAEASSTVGAAEGDSQVNWITKSDSVDHQNVHVATLNSTLSLVTWEVLESPDCQPVPLSCTGKFGGTGFQFVDATGAKVGATITDTTGVTVSGDMAVVGNKICWPYVDQTWDLSKPKDKGTLTTKMSFACAGADGAAAVASSSIKASSTAAPVASSSPAVPTSAVVSSAVSPASSASAAIPTSSIVATSAIQTSSSIRISSSQAAIPTSNLSPSSIIIPSGSLSTIFGRPPRPTRSRHTRQSTNRRRPSSASQPIASTQPAAASCGGAA